MLYLISASFFWALSYGLVKHFLTGLDPNFIASCRIGLALLLFIPLFKARKVEKRLGVNLLAIGAVQYGITYVLYLYSFRFLESHQVALFAAFTPIYVVLVSHLLRRKAPFPWFYLGMASLAILGASVIRYQGAGNKDFWTGFWILQLADLCFASGQVAYKRLRERYTTVRDKDVYALVFAGALSVALICAVGTQAWESAPSITGTQVLVLLYLGIFATGLGFFFWNFGATKVATGTLAVMNNLKIPLAVTCSLVIFQEQADLFRLGIGAAILFGALYCVQRRQRKTALQK